MARYLMGASPMARLCRTGGASNPAAPSRRQGEGQFDAEMVTNSSSTRGRMTAPVSSKPRRSLWRWPGESASRRPPNSRRD